MSNIMVKVDVYFKKELLKLLEGNLKPFNLNDITFTSLIWHDKEGKVEYNFWLHPDSLTSSDRMESYRIECKKNPNKKEKAWMYKHNAKGHWIVISTWSKKQREALEQFCRENKISFKRYNIPKQYNITWW